MRTPHDSWSIPSMVWPLCTVVGTLLFVLMGTALAAAADDDSVECGMTVTEDLVLDRDLDCHGNALHVHSSSQVKIDLDGHEIRGSGVGTGVSGGSSGVMVRNGTVSGFEYAIVDQKVKLVNMYIGDNEVGIPGGGGDARDIIDSVFEGNGRGAETFQGVINANGSRFVDNGVALAGDDSITVVDSEFEGNRVGVTQGGGGNTPAATVVRSSGFVGNHIGVRSAWQEVIVIEDSQFVANDIGLTYYNPGTVAPFVTPIISLVGNQFANNEDAGMQIRIGTVDYAEAVVARNVFVGNGHRADETVGDGLLMEGGTGVIVSDNRAVRNARFGMYVPGAEDGGSNFALANGEPEQCVGVDCTVGR